MNIFERTRQQREKALDDAVAAPAPAASAPAKSTGPSFGKSWTPEERALHQRMLVEKLRGR